MDRGAPAPESSSPPSPSPSPPTPTPTPTPPSDNPPAAPAPPEPSSSSKQQQQHKPQQQQHPSRYESQKRRDWNTFLQYLKNHKPPLTLARCSGAHVIEFLKYLDQFGKTKVHNHGCPYFGHPNPPAPCTCPLKQAWGSLDALIGRLRAAYEENGGKPESNPFGARAVRIYLREVRESQAKARGIPYEKKKKRKRTTTGASGAATGEEESSSSSASKVAATTTSEGGKNGDGKGEGSGVGTTDKKLTETATATVTVNRDSSPTPRAS